MSWLAQSDLFIRCILPVYNTKVTYSTFCVFAGGSREVSFVHQNLQQPSNFPLEPLLPLSCQKDASLKLGIISWLISSGWIKYLPYFSHTALTERTASVESVYTVVYHRCRSLLKAAKRCPSLLVRTVFCDIESVSWVITIFMVTGTSNCIVLQIKPWHS